MSQQSTKRAALIAGLRALADFYETHPDMPVPFAPKFTHCVLGNDDEAGQAKVARIAEQLGADVQRDGGSANAERAFEGLTYSAFYVSRQRSADWNALVSYSGAIVPDVGEQPVDEPKPQPAADATALVDGVATPVGVDPQDGHVYSCCGKVGRISRHKDWCSPDNAPARV